MVENRTTPEQVGIPSREVTALVEGLRDAGLSMHSVLVVRNSRLVAEGYAWPFDKKTFHRMYSISKSFAGIAIGVLAGEGKISLDDTIDRFFPDYVKPDTDERIRKTKIVDLLRMATPFWHNPYRGDVDMDWVGTFFTAKVEKEPGSAFHYDTCASHLLGVIVERVTGKPFLDYLKEKVLRKIGFSEDAWCVKAPEGYPWAGSGILCTPRDLARFADLVMHKGEYRGEQLLPRAYVEAATKKQIDNTIAGNTAYYGQGYGYQIWMTKFGFAFLGMGDQLAICVPEKELLFVCTADNQGRHESMTTIFDLFEEHLLKRACDTALPENPADHAAMQAALANMKIPHQQGLATTDRVQAINGVQFRSTDADAKISGFRFDFAGDEGTLTYTTPRGEKQLRFGIGKNVMGTLDEPQYSGEAIHHPGGRGYRCLGSAAWESPSVLTVWVQVIDNYFGNMTLTFDFSDGAALTGKKTAEWFLEEYVMQDVRFLPESD